MFRLITGSIVFLSIIVAISHAENLKESVDEKDTDMKWLNPTTESPKSDISIPSKSSKVTYVYHFQIYDPIEDVAQKMRFQQTMKEIGSLKTKPAILLSIDSPGGDPELIKSMLTLLASYSGTKIAFIDHARYGGVFGPSCALVFGCDKIIKHPEASVGGKCQRKPLAFDACKNFPASFIDERNLTLWTNGVAIDETYYKEFLSVARQKGRTDSLLETCFCIGISNTRAFDSTSNRSVPQSWNRELNLKSHPGVDSGTQASSKLFDYVSANYQIPLGKILETKDYKEKKVVISSDMNRQMSKIIPQAKSLARELEDEDRGDTTRKLAAERRVKGLIARLMSTIKLNPQIQYFLRDELQSIFSRHMTYSSSDENWCLDGLSSLQEKCEQKIDKLEEEKKLEKKKKRETLDYKRILDQSEKRRK